MEVNKNINLFIIFLVLLCTACTHTSGGDSGEPELGRGTPQTVALPEQYLSPYAEFISESTVRAFPHLKRYQGFGLIGNSSFQLILDGVSVGGSSSELRFTRKVFVLKSKRWYEQSQIDYLGLQFKAGVRNLPISLKAINPTVVADRRAAQVELVVKLDGTRYQPKVFLNVVGDKTGFYLSFAAPSLISETKSRVNISSTIRVVKKPGVSISDGLSMLYYGGTDILSITSSSKSIYKSGSNYMSLDRSLSDSNGWGGYKVSFGSYASSRYLLESSALKACPPSDRSKNLMAIVNEVNTCSAKVPHGNLVVDIDSEASRDSARMFMIANQGSSAARGFFTIHSGESFSLLVPPDQDFYVKDLVSGEEWGNKTPIRIAQDAFETIHLNPWKLVDGTVVFKSKITPVFFTVQSTNPELKGLNLSRNLNLLSSGSRLSDELFVADEAPLRFRGHPGLYTLKFFYDGYANLVCEMKLVLSEQGGGEQECRPLNTKRVFPVGLDFFSSLRTEGVLKSKRFTDKGSGLAAWVLASDTLQGDINRQTFSVDNSPVSLIDQIVALREIDPQAFIELDCPGDYIANDTYFDLVKRIKPDALRLYQCQRGNGVFKYLAKRWDKNDLNFPYITPVLDGAEGRPQYFSKVIFKNSVVGFKGYFSELKGGNFDVSSGVELSVSQVERKRGGNLDTISLKLNLLVHEGVRVHTVKVFGLNDFSYQKNIVLGKAAEQKIDLKFPIPVNTRFLRLEVWGRVGTDGEASDLLGATRILTPIKSREKK